MPTPLRQRLFPMAGVRIGAGKRLGESLVAAGLIDPMQLKRALEEHRLKGRRLGYQLVRLGFLDEKTLGDFLAERFGVPALGEESIHLNPDLFQDFPRDVLETGEVFPLQRAGSTLTLVMADPTDQSVIARVSKELNVRVNPVVAPQSAVKKHVARHFALEEIREKMGRGDESHAIARFYTHLKDYRFQKMIGVGGFGVVCKCWQISLDRPVAVKVMNRRISRMQGMVERFKREGRIIARLSHPNVIQVFEQGEAFDLLYIVMEYFEGVTLDEYCASRDLVEKIGCLVPICDALHYASQRGVVHRDVKPANILANELGEVKLLDFGVALHQDPGEDRLTRENVVLGTPKYMAPEYFADGGAGADTRGDIFAMGVLAYELLTGDLYEKGGPVQPAQMQPTLPEVLCKALEKALEPDPVKRLSSFDLFRRALAHARDQMLMGAGPAPRRRPRLAPPDEAANVETGKPSARETPPEQEDAPAAPMTPGEALRHAFEELTELRNDDLARVVVAKHRDMERKVVLKRLAPRFVDLEKIQRLSEIKHPNIVEVLGQGTEHDRQVLVLEYLEGGSLAARMQSGAVCPENCALWFHQMVLALQTALQRGVAHGRLHPGNMLLTSAGHLKIADFWSKAPRDASKQYARFSRPDIQSETRQDMYGLGVVWFEMLTGERFRGAQSCEVNFRKVLDDSSIEPLLKMPLGRLWGIQRFGRRYEDYAEMAADLQVVRDKIVSSSAAALDRQSGAGRGRRRVKLHRLAVCALYGLGGLLALLGLGVLLGHFTYLLAR